MPFDWKLYLTLAEELSQRSEEEALRSAISRAYYAAFCTARNHLMEKGEQIPISEFSHKLVWDLYLRRGKSYGAVYQNGNRLKNLRRRADYEDEINNLAKLVTAALADADKVFYWLDKIVEQEAHS